MGDEHDGERRAVHEPSHQLEQLHLMAHVERHRGLIQDQEARLLGKRPGHAHPLVLTAGKGRHPASGQMARVALRQRPVHRLVIGRALGAEHREMRVAAE